MRTPARTGAPVAAVLLVLALLAGACSGDDGGDGPGAEASATATGSAAADEPAPITTTASLGVLTGKLGRKDRARFTKAVTRVVDDWIDAAYLDGDYPRGDFRASFPHFTTGARAEALRERDLMTNQDVGRRIDGVTATRRVLHIDALVVRHRPVGATARFVLRLRTTGDLERRIEVAGRLFLTQHHGWRIFGYDVHKGALT
ncbi:hypothetical protein H5V45_17800 [Nocardioides sp. KIGAM211]|uniref:DUF4440 domain-containing protein n=1 Tax=Nocardioides luti TaxID=2761101 RepID=A0A7X0VBY3_9ACTN|nr:hypothetical protein [Nocardioides luti]MBB6629186.1 hypothetical protein [Nocardioides luti]